MNKNILVIALMLVLLLGVVYADAATIVRKGTGINTTTTTNTQTTTATTNADDITTTATNAQTNHASVASFISNLIITAPPGNDITATMTANVLRNLTLIQNNDPCRANNAALQCVGTKNGIPYYKSLAVGTIAGQRGFTGIAAEGTSTGVHAKGSFAGVYAESNNDGYGFLTFNNVWFDRNADIGENLYVGRNAEVRGTLVTNEFAINQQLSNRNAEVRFTNVGNNNSATYSVRVTNGSQGSNIHLRAYSDDYYDSSKRGNMELGSTASYADILISPGVEAIRVTGYTNNAGGRIDGRVGIGTSTPDRNTRLDVNGSIRVNGPIKSANGDVIVRLGR